MTFGSLLIIALVCHASFVGFLKSFTLGDMTFGSLLIIALVCHASFVHGFRVAKRSDDELEVTDPNAHISDLSSKQGMQSRGWVFSPGLTTMADPIGGHNSKGVFETCMNKSSAKVYGYVDGDAVGSIKTPQLSGSGTGSLEFGNCWRFGYVGVYKNGQTIATSSQQGRWKTTTFNFQDGDQLELRDEGGRSVIMIKAINLKRHHHQHPHHHHQHPKVKTQPVMETTEAVPMTKEEALADVSTVVGASFTTREETDEGRR